MDRNNEEHEAENRQRVAELDPTAAIKAPAPKVDEPSRTTTTSSRSPDPPPVSGAQQTASSGATSAGTAGTGDPHVTPARDTEGGGHGHPIAARKDGTGNTAGQISDGQQKGGAASGLEKAAVLQPPPPPPAAGRSMVPDKEDDELVEGAPRQVLLKNYASKDSGAVILESSAGSKGMGNLLVDNRDSYAISPCEEKQWAVFGLSEDIMVRTVKIISHEKYSSLVKDFQASFKPRKDRQQLQM